MLTKRPGGNFETAAFLHLWPDEIRSHGVPTLHSISRKEVTGGFMILLATECECKQNRVRVTSFISREKKESTETHIHTNTHTYFGIMEYFIFILFHI